MVSSDPMILVFTHGYYWKASGSYNKTSLETLNQITNINQKYDLNKDLN